MSEKNANFHRLATRRVEDIKDKVRVFSNLCGQSYEWTTTEVMAYVVEIEGSLAEAIARFSEQKQWVGVAPAPETQNILSPAEPEPDLDYEDPKPKVKSRQMTIDEILAETDEPVFLAEMIAMQREVIANLQRKIDGTQNEVR